MIIMSEEPKKLKLGTRDYITIGSFLFLAGVSWAGMISQGDKIQDQNKRIENLEKINPDLIEHRLGEIEESLDDIEDLIKELGK